LFKQRILYGFNFVYDSLAALRVNAYDSPFLDQILLTDCFVAIDFFTLANIKNSIFILYMPCTNFKFKFHIK